MRLAIDVTVDVTAMDATVATVYFHVVEGCFFRGALVLNAGRLAGLIARRDRRLG